jgi:hypothetical protein
LQACFFNNVFLRKSSAAVVDFADDGEGDLLRIPPLLSFVARLIAGGSMGQ